MYSPIRAMEQLDNVEAFTNRKLSKNMRQIESETYNQLTSNVLNTISPDKQIQRDDGWQRGLESQPH